MNSARFPDSIFCACVVRLFVRLCVCPALGVFVGFICLFRYTFVIFRLFALVLYVYIYVHVYIYVSIYIDASWPVIIPFTGIIQLYFCSFRGYYVSSLISA